MKILIVSYYFPPMNSVASFRIYSWARVWTDAGHNVTVLTVPKPLEENLLPVDAGQIEIIECSSFILDVFQKMLSLKGKAKTLNKNKSTKKLSIRYLFQKLNNWRKHRGIMYTLRMPDYLSLWKRPALKKIKDRKFDAVVSSFGPYVSHLIAEKVILNKQADIWVADYRDLWVDHGLMKGLFPFTILENKLQYRINRRADFITTVSEPLAESLCKHDIPRDKIHVIYNGYLDKIYLQSNQYEMHAWSDNKKHLVYTGSVYEGAQDYSALLNAVEKLKIYQPNLFCNIEIVIASRNYGKLFDDVNSRNINECFIFCGNVIHQHALQMQKDADILLFFDYNPQIMQGVITGKLFEYMSSGTEVWSIGSSLVETNSNDFIIKSNVGKIFGDDHQEIYLQLCNLLTSNKKNFVRANMGFIKQFTRESQANKMLSLIMEKSKA